jgi:hypothetical protein
MLMPWQDRAEKARKLAQDIDALAARAGAAGFQTIEYILKLAADELQKDIEKESKGAPRG